MVRLLAAFTVAACFSPLCMAKMVDGRELRGMLLEVAKFDEGKPFNQFRAGTGAGYVAGVIDAQAANVICSPPNVTRGQYQTVVLKFLNENPDMLAQSADVLIVLALSNAFPCAKAKK